MKKVVISIGLAAVGTMGLHAQGMSSMQTTKVWTLSGTLRGFYDDNYNTAPEGSKARRSSIGFQFSPSVSINVPLEQTQFGLRYTYGLFYYQDRSDLGVNPVDQTHQFDVWMDHAFNENWQMSVQDSFVVGQEPDLIGGGQTIRTSGDTVRNTGSVKVTTQWTQLLSSDISYKNNVYHYINSTYAAELDRMENYVTLDMGWQVLPTAVVGVGYQYQQINYTADQSLAPYGAPAGYKSDNRDNRSHIGFVSVQYNPLDNFTAALKLGAQFTDTYNPPAGVSSSSDVSPWVDLSATYTYLPGSYVQVGFSQSETAESFITPTAAGEINQYSDTSTVYGSINHKFSPELTGSVDGKIQYMTVNGGPDDGQSQTYYTLGVNLSYAFNQHVSAEVGYNFDDLDASAALTALGQTYKRNRAYIGVTATY
jgi:hypothetical protein